MTCHIAWVVEITAEPGDLLDLRDDDHVETLEELEETNDAVELLHEGKRFRGFFSSSHCCLRVVYRAETIPILLKDHR